MTSLIAWIGTSSSKWNSVYLASDSRISWNENTGWNNGKKLFASKHHPEILGYCGEVLFPSQVLSQIIEHIDADLLFDAEDTPEIKFKKIASIIKQSFQDYPKAVVSNDVSIIYGTREPLDVVPRIWLLTWTSKGEWREALLPLPSQSGLVKAFGSGKEFLEKYYYKDWNKSEIKNTSRIVFSSFCDALKSEEDPRSGGAPQLVGIYRQGAAKSFGVIYKNDRYLSGLLVNHSLLWQKVQWFNELFECCDAQTKMALQQRHARPRKLNK